MKSPIFFFCAPAFFLFFVTAGDTAAQWSTPERITNTSVAEVTSEGAIAIDGKNVLHTLWTEVDTAAGTRRLIYMQGSAGNWSVPQEIPITGLTETWPDFAVHTDGTAHVVWYQGPYSLGNIFHATNRTGVWVVQQITFNTTQDTTPTVAVDGDNFAHIAWAGFDAVSNTGKIFHATNRTGSWVVQVLSGSSIGSFWAGASPRISVSAAGLPQITYRGDDYPFYRIHHATIVAGVWAYQVLATGNAVDGSSSVRTDHYGDCFLAISGNLGWSMPARTYFTASTDGGVSWSSPVLVTGGYSAATPVLGVDWQGNSHIVWQETNGNFYTGTIFYTTDLGGSWATTQLTGSGENARPSIAVDGSGGVHVLYTNPPVPGQKPDVYYLTNAAPTLTITLDPRGSTTIVRGDILTLDVSMDNRTSGSIAADFWISAIAAATGGEVLVPQTFLNFPNPLSGTLSGNATVQRKVVLDTPPTVPVGLFTLVGTLGDLSAGTCRDRSVVSVRIVP
jgi:hypothetical protein